MAGPGRYCPACYGVNSWSAETCDACGTPLAVGGEAYEDRLFLVGDNEYGSTAESLDRYFLPFATAARRGR